MPLPEGTSELRSTGPNLVPFLATTCLYWAVHLSPGQLDPSTIAVVWTNTEMWKVQNATILEG